MKTRTRKQLTKGPAFTIVELLTVMAVIAMLIGLLVPALNLVRRHAKDTQQRAQFNAINAGLEIFKNDYSDYPDSAEIDDTGGIITGAQRMTEALVGRDLQGFDPASRWHPALDVNVDAYSTLLTGTPITKKQQSLNRRTGPYLKLENLGCFNVDQIYGNVGQGGANIYGESTTPAMAPMITDVYTDKSIVLAGRSVKTGTPLLYYKANTALPDLQATNRGTYSATTGFPNCRYNYRDNDEILKLNRMMDQNKFHPMSDLSPVDANKPTFYGKITNPQIATNPEGVPYNFDSYIIMSAGRDGLFGTSDDVDNFGH